MLCESSLAVSVDRGRYSIHHFKLVSNSRSLIHHFFSSWKCVFMTATKQRRAVIRFFCTNFHHSTNGRRYYILADTWLINNIMLVSQGVHFPSFLHPLKWKRLQDFINWPIRSFINSSIQAHPKKWPPTSLIVYTHPVINFDTCAPFCSINSTFSIVFKHILAFN